jgi:uncharacterized protein
VLQCVYIIYQPDLLYLFLSEYPVVSQSHQNPLRINVGFLLNQPIGASRDIHFELENLKLHPDLELRNFIGLVRLGRTPQGVLVSGEFQAGMEMECVRCLTPHIQPLQAAFKELYAFKNKPTTEAGLVIPSDWNIDLAPLIREYLFLEIPIKPLCRPDCKGLCPECGADLNETICEHQEQRITG